uniref:Uncharacterized protein n=1 Tax=Trypanosoma congolense (strain IL3000) TaxID=1068625 RepID=G0URU2_TRYCI|nr:conserved hypothetical protein [Trypanosoma congolense IL3000]
MVATGLSSEALVLLQSYGINLKDFSKAQSCYERACAELSNKASTGDDHDEAAVASSEALQRLREAWQEFTAVAQAYFRTISTAILDELVDMTNNKLVAAKRAEKLNELCAVGEKWHTGRESTFQIECPEKLATVVGTALDSSSCIMRLLALQLTRIFAGDVVFLRSLLSEGGDGLIGMCFDRENSTELEYVLSLCKRMIELHKKAKEPYPPIPFGWVYRIAALLDLRDPVPNLLPKRRSQALCIAVMLFRQFPQMAAAASLHITLLKYCIEKGAATHEEKQSVVQVILDMFDSPEARQYLGYNDLDVLYAPFLYSSDKCTPDDLALMNGAKDVLVMLMRTWVGVLWTCSETKGLRAVIDVLHLPCDVDRKMVLLTLFNKLLYQLAPHRGITLVESWQGVKETKQDMFPSTPNRSLDSPRPFMVSAPASGRHNPSEITVHEHTLMEWCDEPDEFVPTTRAIGYHVLDPILGRVLLMLSHHGLPIALVSIIQDPNSSSMLTHAALSLLQDLLTLMDTVLPERPVKRLHTALNKAVGRLALDGCLSLEGVLSSRVPNRGMTAKGIATSANVAIGNVVGSGWVSALSTASVATYGLGALEQDDAEFKKMLHDANVGQGVCSMSWNYDLLLLLFQGPLKSMRRFRWVLSETMFFHNLITFYRPVVNASAPGFLTLGPGDCTPQICMLGMVMLDLFLSTREGTAALHEFGFTASLAACLEEVIQGAPVVLSKERIEMRAGKTVIRMVGRYSMTANGLVALKTSNMYTIIIKMFAELSGERVSSAEPGDTLQEVCLQLLRCMNLGAVPNYGVCEWIRRVVRSALCNDSKSVRLCAVKQLREALWRDFSTSMRWGIETLLQTLHDDCLDVVECAFKLLLNVCLCSDEALDFLISLSPTVLMEGDVIQDNAKQLDLNTLLYCIVGRPSGFRFLQCYGWVEKELRRWEETESANHVKTVENMQSGRILGAMVDFREGMSALFRHRHNRTFSDTAAGFQKCASESAGKELQAALSSGIFPSHFAAVLCRSNEGCTLFKHSDLWQRSVSRILQQPMLPDIAYECGTCGERDSGDDIDVDVDGAAAADTKNAMIEEEPSYVGRWGTEAAKAGAAKQEELHTLRLSREGRLPSSHPVKLLSASRGYQTAGQTYTIECVGDVAELKDAILCVCHAASSDTGFSLMRSVPMLLKQLVALSRYADTASVSGICIVGECLLARSRRCASHLMQMSHYVLNESNAYTSADGVPYSVAFADNRPSNWTAIGRRENTMKMMCSPPFFAHIHYSEQLTNATLAKERDSCSATGEPPTFTPSGTSIFNGIANVLSGVSVRLLNHVFALSNPVQRESARNVLSQAMKHQPQLFLNPQMRRVLRHCALSFRLRHAERKFISSLLEDAPLAKPVSMNRKAVVVVPEPQRV